MSYYSESNCGTEVAQNFLKMDKCIDTPANPTTNHKLLFNSLLLSCEQMDGKVDLAMTFYSSPSCGGKSQDVTYSFSPDCSGRSAFTCVPDIASSTAVVQNWPAIGAYSGDDNCTNVDAITSSGNGACVPSANSGAQWSVKVQAANGNIEGEYYDASATCNSDPISFSAKMGACQGANNGHGNALSADHTVDAYLTTLQGLFVKLGLPTEGPSLFEEGNAKSSSGAQLFYMGNTANLMPLTPPL
jgi:hypothetical protein